MSKDFFSKAQQEEILKAIQSAELNSSGEIRVHLERKCGKEVLDRAAEVFSTLNMLKTQLRNGVLFYLAWESHRFAILGDAGINEKVEENFWDHIKDHMTQRFKEGEFAKGLSEGIEKAGIALKQHFPYQSDDKNELSDEISFGD